MPTSPFCLDESILIAKMMLDGKSRREISEFFNENNLFSAKKQSSRDKFFGNLYNRLNACPDELKKCLCSEKITDIKVVNLIIIMNYDDLFREFVFDTYSYCRQRNKPITDYDLTTFFERKAMESEIVAEWKRDTIKRLSGSFVRTLRDAGLLMISAGERTIVSPFISKDLTRTLVDLGYREYLNAVVDSL